MKTMSVTFALLSIIVASGMAQDRVTEPSTGKSFESKAVFSYNGTDYVQQLTGMAVRKKLVFKVYGMAHYMQEPAAASRDAAFKAVLTDGPAKEIVMTFVRDVDRDKIREAYREGFKENASTEDLKKLQPLIDRFVGYFTGDVKENDQFVLHWLPGGVIIAVVQGEQKNPITDVLFARTLWSIWFGEDSIVDRDDLIDRMVK